MEEQTDHQPLTTDRSDVLLPLDVARVVNFRDRGNPFTWHFRRLTDDDWRNYFAGGIVESERQGQAQINRIDFASPGLLLVDEALVKVEGYRLRDGAGEFMELRNWKERLPLGHKQLALNLLQRVEVNRDDRELAFDPELEEVRLDAFWETASKADGSNTRYRGLIHRLHLPSVEQKRKFFRAASESRLVGGSRTGRTIYANRRGILLDLYDELIAEVEGYSLGGRPIGGVGLIVEYMDGCHKAAAVAELFAQPEYEEPES